MYIALTNGRIITPTGILEGNALLIDGPNIIGIVPMAKLPGFDATVETDMRGQYLTPGFIDIHSDMIEQIIQPRPSAMMDFEMAIKEGEKQLVNQGITTMYHSLSLYNDSHFGEKAVRKAGNVKHLAALIGNLHERDHLIHHRFHARYEIDNIPCFEDLMNLIDQGLVHELSIMDHTPGQGQYRDLEIYRHQLDGYRGHKLSEVEWETIMQAHNSKAKASIPQLRELIALAKAKGISVASHDDDTPEKLELVRELGVDISEFPITMEVAKAARSLGLLTVAGAPNILLGGSHAGNLSAAEAIAEDAIDVLCSDYYPAAMLHAVFALHSRCGVPLHRAVALVTMNPARAVGIDGEYGSLAPGKKADLLVIECLDGYPTITQVMIHGKWVSRLEYRV